MHSVKSNRSAATLRKTVHYLFGRYYYYEETVYNEERYIERERGLIRQSNLDLELEELEERHIRAIRDEGLLRPVPIKPGENESDAEMESPPDQSAGEIPF